MICLTTAIALGAGKDPVLIYPCNRTAAAPKIDGQLDDAAWKDAALVSGFVAYDKHERATVQTAFRAVYDDQALYIGVQCDEPMWQKLVVGTPGMRDDHAGVFRSEAIEIFIDPKHDHADYFQIAVNISGSIFDGRGTDPSWNGKATAAGAVSEGKWSLEVRIPWADLGIRNPQPGTVIGLNVCRDRNLGDKEWTTWSPIAANFHDPLHFGHIVLSGTPEMIGQLSTEFRKGGLDGPLQVFGPQGFSGTTYLALTADSLKRMEATLQELESLQRSERSPEVAAALEKRIAAARLAVAPIAEKVKAGSPLDASEWLRTDMAIEKLRADLGKAIWEARLDALLRGI
jgi:hypothetical protein